MLRLGYRQRKTRQTQYKCFSSGFFCQLFYSLTYLALSNSSRFPVVKFPAMGRLKPANLYLLGIRGAHLSQTH